MPYEHGQLYCAAHVKVMVHLLSQGLEHMRDKVSSSNVISQRSALSLAVWYKERGISHLLILPFDIKLHSPSQGWLVCDASSRVRFTVVSKQGAGPALPIGTCGEVLGQLSYLL